ncbi:MAG: DUF3040 domain-containing protein [Actinobacteria bacterium]|nr:DUF3040 domain-containing protein [Actinomycetota bacterium]
MPLSEHEQHILEEIERRLSEEDPRFARAVGEATLHTHAAKRMRLGVLLFILGFFMLLLFPVADWGQWAAIAGFGVMLASALLVYHYLKQMGRDQLQSMSAGGKFSLSASLARLAERFRGSGGGAGRGNPPGDN